MNKHTPGPWECGPNPMGQFTNELVVRPAGEFPHGLWVADVGAADDEERQSNARLIAAAPDLLKVATELVEAMARYEMDVEGEAPAKHRQMMRRAHAVIAKATP